MPLDFEKLKTASQDDLLVIALCEFSRFVDAIERIAPTVGDLHAAEATTPDCPHPTEGRQNHTRMGAAEWSDYFCTACKQRIVNGVAVS
jgi:hypothetical protein